MSADRRAAAEGPRGPLVCDLFVGSYPRMAGSVIRLPRIVRLDVRAPSRAAADTPVETLQFRSRALPAPMAEPLPDRASLTDALQTLVRADSARAAALEARAHAARAAQRMTVRAETAPGTRSAAVHVRVSPGRSRASFSPRQKASSSAVRPRPRTRARSATSPAPLADRRAVATPRAPRLRVRRVRWREAVRVAVGGLSLSAAVLVLAAAGSLLSVGERVQSIAGKGRDELIAGVQSLLTADAQTSTSAFSRARGTFERAGSELATSTTLLERMAGTLDPAGRLPAAQTLLAVGERTAALGAQAADLVALFQTSSVSLTETLDAAGPTLAGLAEGLRDVMGTLGELTLSGLPADVGSDITRLRDGLRVLHRGLQGFLDSQAVVLELLGSRRDRQYLLLFQNNRELRPTGGFIGSFALVDVSRGEVRKVQVDTIYNPDGQLPDVLLPPTPLRKITDRWFARDANWFADFRASAAKVAHLFERSGGPTVDGVLAVTPTVLEDLLRLTGPIPMPAYGVTVNAENVVAETQRLVTYEYDRAANTPKAFLADLLPEILARVAALPRAQWGSLLEVFTGALDRKHLLVFFRDAEAERAVVHLGWGGALPELPPASPAAFVDHLGRVEANIGGHKTDALMEQGVEYDVTVDSEGAFVATLVVTRHHRGPRSGTPGLPPDEDPAQKPNIVFERTFVPFGSTVLEARGFTRAEDVPSPYKPATQELHSVADADVAALESAVRPHESGILEGAESGFTTFGGWIVTLPEETTVTVLRYRLPFALPRPTLIASVLRYELLLTKQPGHLPALTKATLRIPDGFRFAWTGPAEALSQTGAQKVTFAAQLDRDAAWGAVFEEQ